MTSNTISRRDVLSAASLLSATSLLRLSGGSLAVLASDAVAARDAEADFAILSAHQARQLEAIAARIIPATDTPGAREAGVVYFFDSILGKQMAGMKEALLAGLDAFEVDIDAHHPGARFTDFDDDAQDEILKAVEDRPFFGLVHTLTVFGFFAMEKHGGNRNHLSWDLIDFHGHGGAKQYPFGYYDAEVHGGHDDD
jgi:gluconate 2-dehydrogenase gamma chain